MTDNSEALNQSTQSKYQRVRKQNVQPEIEDNEVRITTAGKVKKYVDYSLRLLQGPTEQDLKQEEDKETTENTDEKEDKNDESERQTKKIMEKFDTIVLKATGRAINHAVTTAEVVKRKIGGLHQITHLETLEISDEWRPLEEGLKPVTTTRRVASITIKLTRNCNENEKKAAGYQQPLNNETSGVRRSTTRTRTRPFSGYNYRSNRNPPRRDGNFRGRRPYRGRDRRIGGPRNNRNYRDDNRGYRGDNRGFRGNGGGYDNRRQSGGYNNRRRY